MRARPTDRLLPVVERPKLVPFDSTRFDANPIGRLRNLELKIVPGMTYVDNGLFILDTSVPGNSNSGHEFTAGYISDRSCYDQPTGVVGPALREDERLALIEYLKTL